MKFIDEVAITAAAGNGGDGVVAWRREKYVPNGGPAGGDGGRGGDIMLEATPNLSTLVDFRFKRIFAAPSGENGSIARRSGPAGTDLVIPVPIGTLVYRAPIDADGNVGPERLYADLSEPNERLTLAKGGRGGLGNQHFATAARQAPTFAEKGQPGEKCQVRLELKLLADCGLIGLPNAGKSTLLSVASAARPKVADYPFTTLEPQLGVVRIDIDESFVMVDVPGLIEGAHEGHGLGIQFLKHVDRTRVLLHLMDGARSREELIADKMTIEHELVAWNPRLAERPTIPVITKLDIPEARERFEELKDEIPGLLGISAATGEGVRELLYHAWTVIGQTPLPSVAEPEAAFINLAPNEPFIISRDGEAYVVSGERVERLASMTDLDSDEGMSRFEQILAKMGVDKKLRELGVQEGDTVRVAGVEFTYS
jgi:GTP-binding protein